MSTHNLHFHGEIRKKYQYFLVKNDALPGAMDCGSVFTCHINGLIIKLPSQQKGQ